MQGITYNYKTLFLILLLVAGRMIYAQPWTPPVPSRVDVCIGDTLSVTVSPVGGAANPTLLIARLMQYDRSTFDTLASFQVAGRVFFSVPSRLIEGTYELYSKSATGGADSAISTSVLRVGNPAASQVRPTDYTLVGRIGSRYYFRSRGRYNALIARDRSQASGGFLPLHIDSATKDLLATGAEPAGTWIGAQDAKIEGVWRWDDETVIEPTFWAPGEPNNSGNEDFAILKPTGLWNDVGRDVPYSYFLVIDPLFNRTFRTVTAGAVQLVPPPVRGATFEWYGPGGFFSTDSVAIIRQVLRQNLGDYFLIVSRNGCQTPPLSFKVDILDEVVDTALYRYSGFLGGFDHYTSRYNAPIPHAINMSQSIGGFLADPQNAAENNLIRANNNGRSTWIGVTSEGLPPGVFHSMRTGQPHTWFNWAVGEPNNRGGVETYVELRDNGQWNDIFPSLHIPFAIKLPKRIIVSQVSQVDVCPGTQMALNFLATGHYGQGNQFNIELSDGTGSFSRPTVLTQLNQKTRDAILFTIPANFPAGSYRVRVNSTNPAITGIDNGIDIRVTQAGPLLPLITQVGDSLYVDRYDQGQYTWFYNGQPFGGCQGHVCAPDQAGVYTVEVRQGTCQATSMGFTFIRTGLKNLTAAGYRLRPNPAASFSEIAIDGPTPWHHLTILDMSGRMVKSLQYRSTVPLNGLPRGIYTLRLTDAKGVHMGRLIVE